MNNKIRLFVVIGLVLMIGIGGKVFTDGQKDREVTRELKVEVELIEAERMSVAVFVKIVVA